MPDVAPSASGSLRQPESGTNACSALLRAAEEAAGQLHLIALGPLTNIAVALQLDPSLPSRLASFTFMGAAEAVGNVTPCECARWGLCDRAVDAVALCAARGRYDGWGWGCHAAVGATRGTLFHR